MLREPAELEESSRSRAGGAKMLIAGGYGVKSEVPDGIGTELRSYARPRAGDERCMTVLAP